MNDRKAISSDEAAQLVGQITALCRNLRNYPPTHPPLVQLAERGFRTLTRMLLKHGEFHLTLAGTVLLVNQEPLKESRSELISRFVRDLGSRRLGDISFVPGVEREEFLAFCASFAKPIKALAAEGGLARLLHKQGVVHILIQEIPWLEGRGAAPAGMATSPVGSLTTSEEAVVQASRFRAVLSQVRSLNQPALLTEETVNQVKEVVRFPLAIKDFEELIGPYLGLLLGRDAWARASAPRMLAEIGREVLQLGRVDQVEMIVDHLVEGLFREGDRQTYGVLITSLESIARKLMEENRTVLAGRISDTLAEQLRLLADRPQAEDLISTLARIGDSKAILGLASVLHRREIAPRLAAALIDLGDRAVSPLLTLLEMSEDRSVRLQILPVLARIGSSVLKPILRALSDDRWYVRRNGCLLLGMLKSSEAVPHLVERLDDADPRVRKEALVTLVEIRGPEAEPAAISALRDRDPGVRLRAVELLGHTGGEQAVRGLISLLRKRPFFAAGESDQVRVAACRALGRIGDRRAEPALNALLSDGSLPFREAARAALRSLQERATQVEKKT